jgi:hypothetical protein
MNCKECESKHCLNVCLSCYKQDNYCKKCCLRNFSCNFSETEYTLYICGSCVSTFDKILFGDEMLTLHGLTQDMFHMKYTIFKYRNAHPDTQLLSDTAEALRQARDAIDTAMTALNKGKDKSFLLHLLLLLCLWRETTHLFNVNTFPTIVTGAILCMCYPLFLFLFFFIF